MSMLARFAAIGAGLPTYVDDVFSTHLYTGNGSTQTITNGIDLAGKGGLVWIKSRFAGANHRLFDTARGVNTELRSNTADGNTALANSVTAFNSNGFSLGSASEVNTSTTPYAAWTFRKAGRFLDVVSYTGTGGTLDVTHSLGQTPGMIAIKRTDTASSVGWAVWHTSSPTQALVLNATNPAGDIWGSIITNVTGNSFRPSSAIADINASGGTYIAYVFAHDTGPDGIVQCGSFTTNGSGNATVSDLGWEPQFVMFKASSASSHWFMFDNVRGWDLGAIDARLRANVTDSEDYAFDFGNPTSNGFSVSAVNSSATFIYLAVRRSNKPPTSGTQVFQPTVYTGTNVDNRLVDTTVAPDLVFVRQRNDTALNGLVVGDRLRGQPYLVTGTSAAEVDDANAFDREISSTFERGPAFSAMAGFYCGNDATAKLNVNTTANNHVVEAFKRAVGFFDAVCYTGNGALRTIKHNLGAAPELMIVKARSAALTGNVYCSYLSGAPSNSLYLFDASLSGSAATSSGILWGNTAPTSSQFTVDFYDSVNRSGDTFVAYLFASLPGISKVGTYTGNGGTAGADGTSQTINCGFTTGARFVLIKRTDGTGDWFVFDSARGIVTASDPYLLLNSTAAEVTSVDAVDADNTGFIINQTSGTNLNVTSATYIYLAIA